MQKTRPLYWWEGVFTVPLHSDGSYSIVTSVFFAAGCLPIRCLEMNVYSDYSILVFGRHVTVVFAYLRWAFEEVSSFHVLSFTHNFPLSHACYTSCSFFVLYLVIRIMMSCIFWDITSCILLKVVRRFRGTCRLHFQGRIISQARKHEKEHSLISHRTELFITDGVKTSNPSELYLAIITIRPAN
jgi:hypothetical protein